MEEFVNRVAASGLVTLDLEAFMPAGIVAFDLRGYLYMDQVIREKDFREQLKKTDWSAYQGKTVALCCTAEAVIPAWALMLAAVYLQPVAARVAFSTPEQLRLTLLLEALDRMDPEKFRGQRVVVKGCGDQAIPPEAYVAVTSRLLPVVRSLMYGEPCSTVPLFKSP